MRPDLERIAQIERYINDELSVVEREAFEEELRADPALREALQLQRDILGGVSRGALKQQVRQAGRRYNARRLLKRLVIGGTAAVVICGAALWYMAPAFHSKADSVVTAYTGTSLPALNEAGGSQWATADSSIAAQVFNIEAGRDTVIETAGGMVLAIAADGFLNADGRNASGPVSLCVKEALDAATIMKAGLSTTSDGKLLETGGMFFVDARNSEGILKINQASPIYADVPSTGNRAGMMLFKGERTAGGGINWTDPKSLPDDLTAVDIASLDFYPPAYLPALVEQGYATTDRRWTDSVYYSMARWFGETDRAISQSGRSRMPVSDSGSEADWLRDYASDTYCGINPANIQALRSGKFENTLLATREFEARLRLIHNSHQQRLLDLYVNNLDKNLYQIDSVAATFEQPFIREFRAFAALRLGKVRNGSKQFDALRRYYAQQSQLFMNAVVRTQQAMRDEEASHDRQIQQQRVQHAARDAGRSSRIFAEELWKNMNTAYRQLGYERAPAVPAGISGNRPLGVNITATGWHNVDKYVTGATADRKSMDFVDSSSGKKAVLRYEPVDIGIADAQRYDKLLVYLLPEGLSSFMRINGSGGRFSEKLNMLMRYDLVCLAFRGDQRFMLTQQGIEPKSYSGLKLQAVDSASFEKRLRSAKDFGTAISLQEDAAFERLELIYGAEIKRRAAWAELTQALQHSLFPCLNKTGLNGGESEWESDVNADAAPIPDSQWRTGLYNQSPQ